MEMFKKEISEIYYKFMELDLSEIDSYIEESLQLSKGYVYNEFRKYAISVGEEEVERYTLKKRQIKYIQCGNYQVMQKFKKKLEENIDIDFKELGQNEDLIYIIDQYLKAFPKEKEFINKLLIKFKAYAEKTVKNTVDDDIKNKYKKFMELNPSEVDSYIEDTLGVTREYIYGKFQTYAKSISEEEVEKYTLKKLQARCVKYNYYSIIQNYKKNLEENVNINFKELSQFGQVLHIINQYSKAFPEEKEFVNNLLVKFEEHLEQKNENYNIINELNKEVIKTKTQVNNYVRLNRFFSKEEIEKSRKILEDLLLSNLSIEDYCHLNVKYDIKDVDQFISIASNGDFKLSSSIRSILDSRKTYLAIGAIKVLETKLNSGQELDIIDYFMHTRLSVYDSIKMIENNSDVCLNESAHFMKDMLKKYYLYSKTKYCKLLIESEIYKNVRIKKGYQFTSEEKERVINFLNGKVELSENFYSVTLDKLVNGEEIVDTITNTSLSLDEQKTKKI